MCLQHLNKEIPCFDVRSPQEYLHAHIPGAISLPLFSDEERARVGTTYKKKGKQEAIHLGVDIVGPKMGSFVKAVEGLKSLQIYCWRGGMRSGFMSQFLRFVGFQVSQLEGGYKAFRRACLDQFEKPQKLFILGGYTGSGKTEVLQHLRHIDLEALAQHRGSVYGELHDVVQPTSEHFENRLGVELFQKAGQEAIWLEDESRLIGRCQIPNPLFEEMRKAPLFVMQCPLEERVERILNLYGQFSKERWITSTLKIERRLGGERTREVIACVERGAFPDAIRLLLHYYDRAYKFSIERHLGPVHLLPEQTLSSSEWARLLV